MEAIKLAHTEVVRRALRLISTHNLSRDAWLAVRRTGIGSSDAAAAVGLCPYRSQLELWLEKTGRDAELVKPDPDDTTHPVFWGTRLESIVAAAYAQRTGHRIRRVNAVLQHPEYPFLLANLDREVLGAQDVQVLECKTAGEYGARQWRAGVPEHVQLQVQHQLAVTGHRAADVAVLLCGHELEVHRIERDDEVIARLVILEKRFWEMVRTDTPPSADGSESAGRALRCLFPGTSASVDWSRDESMTRMFKDLLRCRAALKAQEQEAERLCQALQQAMGDASEATFTAGRLTYRRSRDSMGVDTARLCAEHPDLAKAYAITKPGSRRFRVCE